MSESLEISNCSTCRKALSGSKPASKSHHECGICGEALCRSCAMYLDAATFALKTDQAAIPDELKHSYYCAHCHQATVQPALDEYNELLARAREVFFFFLGRKVSIPTLKKAKVAAKVERCLDRDETILRLGVIAAEAGHNAIVDAEIDHEKVRHEGWHKTVWKGVGWPASVDVERLERRTRMENF